MIVLTVIFKNAKARASYYDSLKFNKWASEIHDNVKLFMNNPSIGIGEIDLSIQGKPPKSKNIHPLTRDEKYTDINARSFALSGPDKSPKYKGTDRAHPRLVLGVKEVINTSHLTFLIKRTPSEFSDLINASDVARAYQEFKQGEFGYAIIAEVGGHYSVKSSMLLEGSVIDEVVGLSSFEIEAHARLKHPRFW